MSALSTCASLECLHLEHNPVVEDPHYRSVLMHSARCKTVVVTVDICFLWLRHVAIVTGQVYKYAAGEFILSYNLDSHYVFLLLQKSRSRVALECTPHFVFCVFLCLFCLYWAWLWVVVQSVAWKDSLQKWPIVCWICCTDSLGQLKTAYSHVDRCVMQAAADK